MKTCQISGVELDRLKILSDVLNGKLTLKEASHALHLSYRQALDGKRVEEMVRGGGKTGEMEASRGPSLEA